MAADVATEEKKRRIQESGVEVPGVQLSDGGMMPALGLGTLGGSDPGPAVAKAVREALQAGYRSFDCAECYGNESDIGQEFRSLLDSGAVARDELFVTSKVWNTNHAPEHVREACLNTLANLQLEYLDLYLMHWPLAWEYVGQAPFSESVPKDAEGRPKVAKVPLHQTWTAMESLVDEGKVRRIGVSNFTSVLLGDLLSYARIAPVCNQVEMHPYLQQRNLLSFCRLHGIVLSAYCPLARPGKEGGSLLEDAVVRSVAKEKGTTPAAVVLAWAMARGTVALPKSSNYERLCQNMAACKVVLSKEDVGRLDTLERSLHVDTFGAAHGCHFHD